MCLCRPSWKSWVYLIPFITSANSQQETCYLLRVDVLVVIK